MFDIVLDYIYEAIEWALGILPDSPFQSFDMEDGSNVFLDVMGFVNYFVPVGTMLGMLTTYLIAVGMWYVVRWALRLAQYI